MWNPKFENLAICLSFMYTYNLIFFAMNCQCLWEDFPIKTIQDCYAKAIDNTGTCSLFCKHFASVFVLMCLKQ
jgi:hypothetical protein